MGTLNNGPKLATFQNDIYPSGLDLNQADAQRSGGYFKAADAASFEQGMIVMQNASGEVIIGDGGTAGARMLGVAKWNKATLGKSLIVDEEATVGNGTVSQLAHANVSGVVVRDVADGGSAAEIPATSNYTLSAVAGTLTWDNPPAGTNAPVAGDTVFVTYTFDLTDADYKFLGRNFHNFVDDVTIAEGRITVIMPPALIFTTKFVSDLNYLIGDTLYMGGNTTGEEGLFTNDNTGSPPTVGSVVQLPTADYPFLGVELFRA